jgi:hypothetical protein
VRLAESMHSVRKSLSFLAKSHDLESFQRQPKYAIEPLFDLLVRFTPSKSHLTTIHPLFLTVSPISILTSLKNNTNKERSIDLPSNKPLQLRTPHPRRTHFFNLPRRPHERQSHIPLYRRDDPSCSQTLERS